MLLGAFALIAGEIVAGRRDQFDREVMLAVHAWTDPTLTQVIHVITFLGSTTATGALCFLTAAWLLWRRQPLAAVLPLAAWGTGQVAVETVKSLLERGRPDLISPLVHAGGYSFPSGHTFSALIAYGILAALVAGQLRGRACLLPWAAWAMLVVNVAFSRIYLGAHYPTDVLGSFLLGGAWLGGALMMLRLIEQSRRSWPVLVR